MAVEPSGRLRLPTSVFLSRGGVSLRYVHPATMLCRLPRSLTQSASDPPTSRYWRVSPNDEGSPIFLEEGVLLDHDGVDPSIHPDGVR